MKRFAITLAALALAGAACSTPTTSTSLSIDVFQYQPAELTVEAGSTVTVTNGDEILHTVTAGTSHHTTGEFDVTVDGRGATATFTVEEPGTYPYFCTRHPTAMTGTLVVT